MSTTEPVVDPRQPPLPDFTHDGAMLAETKDISNEMFRVYQFVREGIVVPIQVAAPVKLHVSKSGGHRILTADGVSTYIPAGWVRLIWKSKDGAPAFDF